MSDPTIRNRAPRKKTLPTFSTPSSSVIQASNAPLVNVYERPHKAQSAITSHGSDERPTPMTAPPIPMTPMMNDSRLL
jgi:hypothetical protein